MYKCNRCVGGFEARDMMTLGRYDYCFKCVLAVWSEQDAELASLRAKLADRDTELESIRRHLGGHKSSQLDGANGLAQATYSAMRRAEAECAGLQAKLEAAEREVVAARERESEYREERDSANILIGQYDARVAELIEERDAANALLREMLPWCGRAIRDAGRWRSDWKRRVEAHLAASPSPLASPEGDGAGRELEDLRRQHSATLDAIQSDVAELLVACHLGNHARPDSCHGVIQNEILPRIREMSDAIAWVPTDTDARRAQGGDDA